MKNIIITGIPKTGKSTLTELIRKELGQYSNANVYKIDNELRKINPKVYEGPFEQRRFERVKKETQTKLIEDINSNKNEVLIIEGSILTPDILSEELSNINNYIIFYMGFGENDIDTRIKILQSRSGWQNQLTTDELKGHCKDWKKFDNISECEKYKIKYIDSSKDKEVIWNIVQEYIIDNLK